MKPTAIICDLDGTLSNSSARKHYVENTKKKNFNKFYEELDNDPPHGWCIDIIKKANYQIFFVSGRPEKYRKKTQEWICKHLGWFSHEYVLLMREDGNYEQDYLLKERILKTHILPNWNILYAIDDRKQVVDMWRRNGVVCLQCADGDF